MSYTVQIKDAIQSAELVGVLPHDISKLIRSDLFQRGHGDVSIPLRGHLFLDG